MASARLQNERKETATTNQPRTRKLQLDCIPYADLPVDARINRCDSMDTDENCSSCFDSTECSAGSCRLFRKFTACDENNNFIGIFPRVCNVEEVSRELECTVTSALSVEVLNNTATKCTSNNACGNDVSCRVFMFGESNGFLNCDYNDNFSSIFPRLCDDIDLGNSVPLRELDCVELTEVSVYAIFDSATDCWADSYCSSGGSCRAYPQSLRCDKDNVHMGMAAKICPSIEL